VWGDAGACEESEVSELKGRIVEMHPAPPGKNLRSKEVFGNQIGSKYDERYCRQA
jgi:hypothetical protein